MPEHKNDHDRISSAFRLVEGRKADWLRLKAVAESKEADYWEARRAMNIAHGLMCEAIEAFKEASDVD